MPALVGGDIVRVLVHAADEGSAHRAAAEKLMRASLADSVANSLTEVVEAQPAE